MDNCAAKIIVLQRAVSAKQEKPFQRRGEGNLLKVLRERGTSAAKKKGLPVFPISFDLKLFFLFFFPHNQAGHQITS